MDQMVSSPFLHLPRELRDKIYRFILVQDDSVVIHPACPEYNRDPQHRDDFKLDYKAYFACAYHAYHWFNSRTRIADVDILRANSQIYVEAREIFLKENTFAFPQKLAADGSILREDTMKHAARIKVFFESEGYCGGYPKGHNTPIPKELSRFVNFLKSRQPLKRLRLDLLGHSWDSAGFKDLFSGVKVLEQITINARDLEGWDFREGYCTMSPKYLSDEDREFRVLVTKMETDALAS